MPFSKSIENGIQFLLSHRNEDGGIPAVSPNDISGCWTTAEALEVFLTTPYFQKKYIFEIEAILDFLLDTQIPGQGWPLVVDRKEVSTMATGHSLTALAFSEKVFSTDINLVNKINKPKEDAKKWLNKWQNDDGGWGIEPSKSGGKETRIISTCYALRGYFACGMDFTNSQDVKRGINCLLEIANPDGGWGRKKGSFSDPANTARVIVSLLQSNHIDTNDVRIKKGIKFILKSKNLWRIDIESYVTSGAPGQTIFHSNTLFEILGALLICKYFGKEVDNLIEWFIETQEDDGKWYLRDKTTIDKDISTWSTSESIGVLDLAQKHYNKYIFQNYRRSSSHQTDIIICILFITTIFQFIYILDLHSLLLSWWGSRSDSFRQFIIYGVIFVIIVGVIADLISPSIKKFIDNIVFRIKELKK